MRFWATPSARAADDEMVDSALLHTPITEGRRGSAISITVVVQNALPFDRLVLAYRTDDGDEFLGRPMAPVGSGSYSAEIPASATGGTIVSYFIEALNADGVVLAARGSLAAPLVIKLIGDAADGSARPAGDGGDVPERRWLLALSVGSGVGLASGTGDLNADVTLSSTRLAPARLLHFSPEAGLWISRSLLLSLQARLQLITGTTDLVTDDGRRYHAASGAAAVFARASWLFRASADFQPLFSLALGAGQIRHVVAFNYDDCGDHQNQHCVDTVTAGPILAGAGTGFFYAFSESFSLLVQLNAQLAAPRSTVNVDLNLGAAARF